MSAITTALHAHRAADRFKSFKKNKGKYDDRNPSPPPSSSIYSDESDYTFVIASNTLQYDLSSGINVIGVPMALDSSINLVEHLGGEDDNLGDFWLAFNELSESSLFNDFNLFFKYIYINSIF